MASFEKLEDLNLSLDEFKALDAVVSNDHFRKLLTEYAEKISKSEASSDNSSERSHSETETGMRVDPGYVIKGIANGGMKIFVNVCRSETIGKPSSAKQVGRDGKSGLAWTLPHSFSFTQPFEDSKERCKVFDFVVHPDTYRMAETNGRFKKMLNETAIEGIEKEFGIHLEPNRLRFPKMKYKEVSAMKSHHGKRIDSRSGRTDSSKAADSDSLKTTCGVSSKTSDNCSPECNSQMKRNDRGDVAELNKQHNGFVMPKFTLSHNCNCGTPHMPADNSHCSTMTLRVAIDLPLLNSAKELTLDIFEQKIILVSEGPNKYKLDVALPYPVDEGQCHARFVKSRRSLNVTMPVLFKQPTSVEPKPVELVNDNFDDRNGSLCSSVNGNTKENKSKSASSLEPSNCSKFSDCETSSKIDNIDVSDSYEAVEVENKSTPSSFLEDSFMLPEFSFRQDVESISFIFHVANVRSESMSVVVTASGLCFVRMMATDDTTSTVHYSCCLKFENGCCFRDEGYTISTSDDNVVVVFTKDESCRTIWNHFWAGVHLNSLEKHDFVTAANLKKALDGLDDEREELSAMEGSAQYTAPTLQVTQMDEKGLVILMQKPEMKGSSPNSESEIVVIHDKTAPKLHGILKQRTMSESSELSGAERQTSTATCSDADDSDGGCASLSSSAGSGGRVLKKSVSFNDRVDRTLFQTNQSVSSMHTVLKNRRRRARKRDLKLEQKEQMKDQRRRRRSSGSLSMEDSGDERMASVCDAPVVILPGELKEPSVPASSASLPTSILSEMGSESCSRKDPKNLTAADRNENENENSMENSPNDGKIETVSGDVLGNNALMTNMKILNDSETLRTKQNCFEEDYGYETLRADSHIKSDDSFCDETAANIRGINNFDLKKSDSDTDSDRFLSPPPSADGVALPSTRRDLHHFSSEEFAFEVCETAEGCGCGSGDGNTTFVGMGAGGKGPAKDMKSDVGLINSLMFELDID